MRVESHLLHELILSLIPSSRGSLPSGIHAFEARCFSLADFLYLYHGFKLLEVMSRTESGREREERNDSRH